MVAANAVGPVGMVEENVSGLLVDPGKGAVGRYADAIQYYCENHDKHGDPTLRGRGEGADV